MDLLAQKMRELTKNKCFNEDIAALHVNKSEIVQYKLTLHVDEFK